MGALAVNHILSKVTAKLITASEKLLLFNCVIIIIIFQLGINWSACMLIGFSCDFFSLILNDYSLLSSNWPVKINPVFFCFYQPSSANKAGLYVDLKRCVNNNWKLLLVIKCLWYVFSRLIPHFLFSMKVPDEAQS